MSQTASVSSRGSLSTVIALLLGVPLGVAVLWMIEQGPWQEPEMVRYVSHPVEKAEVILFFCAAMALSVKLLGYLRERLVFARSLLPPSSGKAQAAGEAANLLTHLGMQRGWKGSWLGQRIQSILEFVRGRGSANDLDDQLRTLSDNDALALEGSYSLVRFINWAIPILGFLGTVVGITDAIANVTPEILEQSLSGVTSGLATAFDTTALALLLTMVLMFGMFLTERLEQSVLERVDAYVDRHLAHRFERVQGEAGPYVDLLRRQTDVLVEATRQVVDRQAEIWTASMEKAEERWSRLAAAQEAQLTKSMGQALEFALTRYGQRLAEMEQKLAARGQAMIDSMVTLAKAIEDAGERQRQSLAEIGQRLGAQAETLARVQEGEGHLLRLQETLAQNLSALSGAGAFDEAVQSLTAAIHLLTSRAQATPGKKAA